MLRLNKRSAYVIYEWYPRQDIGWYDTHQTNDFAARMAEDLNKLQEGIGEKIGMFIFFMTIFSASLINAFYHGWELTLVST